VHRSILCKGVERCRNWFAFDSVRHVQLPVRPVPCEVSETYRCSLALTRRQLVSFEGTLDQTSTGGVLWTPPLFERFPDEYGVSNFVKGILAASKGTKPTRLGLNMVWRLWLKNHFK
jgi:hypothetical protein